MYETMETLSSHQTLSLDSELLIYPQKTTTLASRTPRYEMLAHDRCPNPLCPTSFLCSKSTSTESSTTRRQSPPASSDSQAHKHQNNKTDINFPRRSAKAKQQQKGYFLHESKKLRQTWTMPAHESKAQKSSNGLRKDAFAHNETQYAEGRFVTMNAVAMQKMRVDGGKMSSVAELINQLNQECVLQR